MRTLNIRLAVILLVIVTVFGVGVYFLHGYQMQRNAGFFYEESERAQQRAAEAAKQKNLLSRQENVREAIRCLFWYIRLEPNDLDAREKFGMLLAENAMEGNIVRDRQLFLQAFSVLEGVVGLEPTRRAARRQLVKMAMAVHRYQDAKDHLQHYLLQESPRDPELLELLGECQMEMGDFDAALTTFQKAVEYGPSQATAYAKLAGLLRGRFSKPDEADQWMAKMVEANPNSARAHFLRGRYLLGGGHTDSALEEAQKAQQLDPNDPEVLWLMAVGHLARREFDEARNWATQGIQKHPEEIILYSTLSEIELRIGNREKAAAALQQGLKATARNPQLLWSLANLLIDNNRLADVQKIIDELQQKGFPQAYIDYLTARIDLMERRWLSARQKLEKIRSTLIATDLLKQIDLWIGHCYGQLGNSERQMQAYRRALATDPDYAPARAALSELFMSMGRADEALEELRQLVRSGQASPSVALPMARMLLIRTLRQNPAERDWTAVENALDAAAQAVPDSVEIPQLRAEMLLAQDRNEEAESVLRQACEKYPKQMAFYRSLAALAERRQDWAQAEKILQDAEAAVGDCAELRLAKAQLLVNRDGKEARDAIRKLLEGSGQFSDEEQVRLWQGLFSAVARIGDTEQADLLLQKIAEKQPDNAQVRYMLFERAMAKQDTDAVRKALDEIERVAGRGSFWLYGQAALILLQSQKEKDETELNKALDYIARARELRRDWSRLALTAAAVYEALGKPEQALKEYLEAMDLGDRNPEALRRTIQLLFQTHQYAEADRRLRQLERELTTLPPELSRASAEVAMQMGNFDRAWEIVRKTDVSESKNYQDHLWQGQMLGILGGRAKAAGNPQEADSLLAEAERELRRAVQLEPKLSQTWLMLVRFLGMLGEETKAEEVLREAAEKIPSQEAPLVVAQCYEVLNKNEQAEEKYDAALAAAPDDLNVVRAVAAFYNRAGKTIQAEALLQRILDGKLSAEPDDLAWARRQMALIAVTRGGYQNLQKALALIEENLHESKNSPLDLRIKAQLTAFDPSRARRDEAVRLLETMLKEQTAAPEDRFTLAQMYLAAGEWTNASNQFRALIAEYDKEPRYLVAYIEALLQRGETSSVAMYLDRLERIAPTWFVTLGLRADLLWAENKPQEALEMLIKFVNNENAVPKDRFIRIRLVAEKLEQLSRKPATTEEQKAAIPQLAHEAEALFRTYSAAAGQTGPLMLAAFLGRQGKLDEALDLLERAMDDSQLQDFLQALAVSVQNGSATATQLQRMEKMLEKALEKFSRPTPMLLLLAELKNRQERYDESENLYREVLKNNAGHAVAMNNLAVLLALQGKNLEEAISLINKAIEIAGPLGAMLDSRASVYIALGKSEEALKDIDAALVDAETPVRLFHKAQAFLVAGQEDAARNVFDKALKKNLTPEMLQPLERPVFERLHKLLP